MTAFLLMTIKQAILVIVNNKPDHKNIFNICISLIIYLGWGIKLNRLLCVVTHIPYVTVYKTKINIIGDFNG